VAISVVPVSISAIVYQPRGQLIWLASTILVVMLPVPVDGEVYVGSQPRSNLIAKC